MANRLEQNVLILDSGMGSVWMFQNSGQILSSQRIIGTSGGELRSWDISAIVLDVQSTSTPALTLTAQNTANVIVSLNRLLPEVHFTTPLRLYEMKPFSVSGTAYVYLA